MKMLERNQITIRIHWFARDPKLLHKQMNTLASSILEIAGEMGMWLASQAASIMSALSIWGFTVVW